VSALTRLRPCMTAENRQIFDLICEARHRPLLRRAAMFARAGCTGRPCSATCGLPPQSRSRRFEVQALAESGGDPIGQHDGGCR